MCSKLNSCSGLRLMHNAVILQKKIKGDIMKRLFFVAIFISFLNSCDTNENDFSRIQPFAAAEIENIEINGKQVIVTAVYGTPTPCWYYYRTENTNNDVVFTSKVYGKDDGDPCIQVLGSFKHDEKIIFSSSGEKTLRFWQNDSTYLDTTITIQ